MADRVEWPGTRQIATQVTAVLPRPGVGDGLRLRDRRGRVVHTLSGSVPSGTRVLLWRGRAFLHWEGLEWRETTMAVAEEMGQ